MKRDFTDMNFVEELRWRGMLHDLMPETEELLANEKVKGYIGFDPTAESLHVGNLVQIVTLMRFQQCGHVPVALVGGATGMVGDPSGKSQERNLLDENTLTKNLEGIKNQLARFLDFDSKDNPALMVNNFDWFKNMGFLDFIRDVGKHITVNYMMAKDSVKRRISGDEREGMSFTEFSYQMVQGYDFYYLWKNEGIKLQMGGSDQWGNITTGTELIRRMSGGSAYALTTQLIKKADGSKFGKSESGNIWLNPTMTSPYRFYQFWLNSTDADAENFIKIFTFLKQDEIESLIEAHRLEPHKRVLQKRLAAEVTVMVHSKQALDKALEASELLFGNGTSSGLAQISESDLLEVMEGVPSFNVPIDVLINGIDAVELLAVHAAVFPSKGEARKMISAGGVYINKEKFVDVAQLISDKDLLQGKYLLVQKGKKNYILLKAV
jgi:tyrosyl-tRNA synthetase